MSSGGTKDMSLDGGCGSEESYGACPNTTTSTATSGRCADTLICVIITEIRQQTRDETRGQR